MTHITMGGNRDGILPRSRETSRGWRSIQDLRKLARIPLRVGLFLLLFTTVEDGKSQCVRAGKLGDDEGLDPFLRVRQRGRRGRGQWESEDTVGKGEDLFWDLEDGLEVGRGEVESATTAGFGGGRHGWRAWPVLLLKGMVDKGITRAWHGRQRTRAWHKGIVPKGHCLNKGHYINTLSQGSLHKDILKRKKDIY